LGKDDIYPVYYRCNTPYCISKLAKRTGFKVEVMETYVGWPSYFEFSNYLHSVMTVVHKFLEKLPSIFHITIVGILRK